MTVEEYVNKLKDYVESHPVRFCAYSADSILEALYFVYSESNRMDNEKIHDDFNALYNAMHGMTLQEMDKIIDVVCSLCREHEYAGFVHGVKVGIQLANEL